MEGAREVPPSVRKSFMASSTDLTMFYHRIKAHKAGPDSKIRPIVSNTNGQTQRISWQLANALKPMLKDVPAHLENSLGSSTASRPVIYMQPRCVILVHFNTHTRSHHQRHRQNSLHITLLNFTKGSFEFYKKPAKKPLFVHYPSAIPEKSKINFIGDGQKRIEDKCSTKTTSTKHQNMFDDVLHLDGYPGINIDQTKHPQNRKKDPPPLSTGCSYLKIPQISP